MQSGGSPEKLNPGAHDMRTLSSIENGKKHLLGLMRYVLVGFLTAWWMVFAGTLHAQDFTVFGGFQHPGSLTLSSGVGGVGRTVGVPSLSAPGDLLGVQIDPKDFGIFGVRLYRSAAPLGLEYSAAYSPNFIDSGGNAFFSSTNLRVKLPAALVQPYVTAGGGLFRAGGSGSASFGTKFSFNYGGGLNVVVIPPAGVRFDVRMHSIRGVENQTLNVLETSVGIFIGF